MLSDPLYTQAIPSTASSTVISTGNEAFTFAVTSYPTGGSLRVDASALDAFTGAECKLSISHSNSNENKPFVTRRSLIRIDLSKVDPESGKTVTMSAYVVVAIPVTDLFTASQPLALVRSLASFLLYGPTNSSGALQAGGADSIQRILNGES